MSSTPSSPRVIKLTYFDFHGGRAEPARIALTAAGIPFTDERVSREEWAKMKPSTLLGGLPILEVDGRQITQSNAINRWVGQLAGLYPTDMWQAAECDEICDMVEHLSIEMGRSFGLTGDEQKRERERLVEGPFPRYMTALAKRLAQRGGVWFAADQLTIADLKVTDVVRMLTSGRLDHVPVDLVERVAPTVVEHRRRVLAEPRVKAYYSRFGL
jgi:prostaglandin-H2 D-isomerase / glutathione transferase